MSQQKATGSRQTRISKRSFLKIVGAGSVAGLAGCSGGGGGGDGGGGGGDGSGDGGSDGSGDGGSGGTTTQDSSGGTMRAVAVPLGVDTESVIMAKIQREGKLQEKLNEVGYSLDLTLSYDHPSLLVSNQADLMFGGLADMEAAIIGPQMEIPLSIVGAMSTNYGGFVVKNGGPYDPDNTGGIQSTFDKIVDDDGIFGIPGWESGYIPPSSLILDQKYGYSLSQDQGDFNVRAAGYGPIPTLTNEGDIAGGIISPGGGKNAEMMSQDPPLLDALYWNADAIRDLDMGIVNLQNFICRQDFLEENREGVRAAMEAWQWGLDWLLEKPLERSTSEVSMRAIGAENKRAAEYLARVFIPTLENNKYPGPEVAPIYENCFYDDQTIADSKKFMNNAAKTPHIPNDWSEWVNYEKI